MLPRWINHYGRQVGIHNLVVFDDNSVDGSTADLPCTTYRLPPPPWKRGWGKTRTRLVNGIAQGLLACNDAVVFADVDEFLVPDPTKYEGLLDFLLARPEVPVIAPLALEVLHHDRSEGALDNDHPLLEQRRFVKFSPGMCKPLVKRVPARWVGAFHAIRAPFDVDRDLWMLHLKYADLPTLEVTAERRRAAHELEGRGHPRSFWPMGAEVLRRRLAGWTSDADATGAVPPFDPDEPDIDNLIEGRSSGSWQSRASQVQGLDGSPLRQRPESLHTIL